MKILKKINIGLVLTIIVLIGITIYSINIQNERKLAKEDIKNSCEEFINLTNKYSVLPTEYQIIDEQSTNIDLTNFYTQMENELKNVTITEGSANIQKDILTEHIENQLINTSKIIVNFDKKITKISSYEFDGNEVTVVFNSKVTVKQKYNDINNETGEITEKINEQTFETQNESITLQKKDGIWKIVVANLQYKDTGVSMYYSI